MANWHEVAAAQHGVIRRGQGGLSRHRADTEIRSGGLVRHGRRALVVAASAPSPDRALWIAACEIGEPMAVSGVAALRLYGVPVGLSPERPEVLVPRWRSGAWGRVARVCPVVACELARARTAGGHRVASVPVSLRRASVDLDFACFVTTVEHVLRLRLATAGQLWRALGHGLVGAQALRDALALADPASHSTWERRLAVLIRRAGLPRPRRQARLQGEPTYWVDFLFEPWGLAVEVDGFVVHAQPDAFVYGLRRARRLRLQHGIDVLSYAPAEIRDHPHEVVAEIATELQRRGARPS